MCLSVYLIKHVIFYRIYLLSLSCSTPNHIFLDLSGFCKHLDPLSLPHYFPQLLHFPIDVPIFFSSDPSLPINKRQKNIDTIRIEDLGSNLPPPFCCPSKIDKLFSFQESYECLDMICSCDHAM